MIRYNLKPLMAKRGIANASQLALEAKVPAPAVYRAVAGEPVDRIEVATLERLAKALKAKTPWALLEYRPDD